MNILRLYGVCHKPLGLVFELCDRGTLQQWLWAEVRRTGSHGRRESVFVSNDALAESSTAKEALADVPRRAPSHSQDSDDSEEDEPATYRLLLKRQKIRGRLQLSHRLLICQELISAVAFLHSRHLAHGDIKSSNVLVQQLAGPDFDAHTDPAGVAPPVLCGKLSDMGSARVQQSVTYIAGSTMMARGTTGGTHRWSAPELLAPELLIATEEDEKEVKDSQLRDAQRPTSALASIRGGQPHPALDERSADVYSLGLVIGGFHFHSALRAPHRPVSTRHRYRQTSAAVR